MLRWIVGANQDGGVKALFLFLLALAASPPALIAAEVGAATSGTLFTTEFIPYRGPQSPDFKGVPNAVMRAGFVVPVYLGYPDRSYEILGCVCIHRPPRSKDPRNAAIKSLAAAARLHGADAMLLNPTLPGFTDYYVIGTAIRWRTKSH